MAISASPLDTSTLTRPFGPPAAFDRSVVTDFQWPAARAADLVGKAATFRREGDAVTANLGPEVAGELLEAEGPVLFRRRRGGRPGGGGGPFNTPLKDPQGSVTFRVEGGVLTEFTLALRGSRRDELIALTRRHLKPSPEAYIKAYERRFGKAN